MVVELRHVDLPNDAILGANHHEFLSHLDGPTVLTMQGRDTTRTRVVVTLLHGNEPSGLRALHRFLSEKQVPATNLKVIIASVNAAKTLPFYTHRMLPGDRDLNRCFNGPLDDYQGLLAQAIAEQVKSTNAEAIIDMHNTSGKGPAFCVSAVNCPKHVALTSHFADLTILTDIRLGAIMEQSFSAPIVTVEAGGAQDIEADENAYCGLYSFLSCDNPLETQQEVELLVHPRRLEILPQTTLCYASEPNPDYQLTLFEEIEKFNFGVTPALQTLGWITSPLEQALSLDSDEHDVSDFFMVEKGMLKTRQALKLFMVTTRADIAKSDCLLYFVTAQ